MGNFNLDSAERGRFRSPVFFVYEVVFGQSSRKWQKGPGRTSRRPFWLLRWAAIWGSLAACAGTLVEPPQIDGQLAFRHVEQMVSFGPHPAGSAAQAQVANYIESELSSYGLQVQRDTFESVTPIGRRTFHNIWGELPGEQESVIILATHFDSKYFTEFVFVGANDGGSSSAVVLELARVLSAVGVTQQTFWFVFFDGEEAFRTWTGADSLYGSRHFVRRLIRRQELNRVKALVLLDLVGGQNVRFKRDLNSTPWLTSLFWETAAEMGHSDIFLPLGSTRAVDDHLPFAEQGIPVIDIIDLENYPYWHREGDTPDKLSPANLQIVGNVVLATLPKISARLNIDSR